MKCTASLAATATVERLRIGVADVLGGEAHQPPRDVERILAGFDHPRQPVDRGVGIAVAHRLVQRRDQVVVLLAATCRRAARAAGSSARRGRRRRCRAPSIDRRGRHAQLEQVQRRRARRRWRTARSRCSASSSIVDGSRAEAALGVGQRALRGSPRPRRSSGRAARTPSSATAAPR